MLQHKDVTAAVENEPPSTANTERDMSCGGSCPSAGEAPHGSKCFGCLMLRATTLALTRRGSCDPAVPPLR